jgi:hypothetical protein
VRPRVSWSIRDGDQNEILSARNKETPVLLPFATMTARFPIAENLPPGPYQIDAQVDFNDGRYIQEAKRTVNLPLSPDKTAWAAVLKRYSTMLNGSVAQKSPHIKGDEPL